MGVSSRRAGTPTSVVRCWIVADRCCATERATRALLYVLVASSGRGQKRRSYQGRRAKPTNRPVVSRPQRGRSCPWAMHPGTSTDVASRWVRTVTRLVPDAGVKCSSPTIEWSDAVASTVQLAPRAPEVSRTSTCTVTEWASTTLKVTSCADALGVDSSSAAIVTGRRHAGGAAYLSVRVWSTRSMVPSRLWSMSPDPARPGEGLRLMHVHARPADESSKGAASTAKYVAEGVDVHVATCTGGERGSILNPKMDRPEIAANITEVRRQEMERARDLLGIRQDWLGFVDSGWPEGDPKPPLPEGCFALVPLEEATERLVRLMRDFKPHVVTTYDEKGGYPHPG